MKNKDLKELKNYYLKIKEDLLKSLSKEAEELDIDGDSVDQIQGQAIATMSKHLSSRDFNRLIKINNAIKLIDNGTVDICDGCGESISYKRLHAIPGVRICISCAEDAEIKSKMFIKA